MNELYFCRNFPNVDLHQFMNKKQKPKTRKIRDSEKNRLYGNVLVLVSQGP